MSKIIRRHVGQLIVAGFTGTTIPSELRALAREFDLGGVILFERNVEAAEQVAELAYEAKNLSLNLPAWVSVDQEGGRVIRLHEPFTEWPSMQALGRTGAESLAKRFAEALALELRTVGVTLDYVPVLDVQTNPRNCVIGDRALSDQAGEVARLGRTIIETLQEGGVAACGKHFPGHGDTVADSHFELPVFEHTRDRLCEVELEPFRMAILVEVVALMTAHVLYPSLDAEVPATLSRAIITGLLREELNFEGLVVTDDMEMAAIAKTRGIPEATVQAVAAGCDMILLGGVDTDRQVEALEAIIYAVENNILDSQRVTDALDRQRRAKERLLGWVFDWKPPGASALRNVLGCREHMALAEEIASYS